MPTTARQVQPQQSCLKRFKPPDCFEEVVGDSFGSPRRRHCGKRVTGSPRERLRSALVSEWPAVDVLRRALCAISIEAGHQTAERR